MKVERLSGKALEADGSKPLKSEAMLQMMAQLEIKIEKILVKVDGGAPIFGPMVQRQSLFKKPS